MIKQKKENTFKAEQPIVILDGISLKHYGDSTFIEIEGDKLNEQLDFGFELSTGNDVNGYPVKYSIRFTAESNMNPLQLKKYTEGFYKLASNNLWIDKRDPFKLILRVAQVEKFECYYAFEKQDK